MVIHDATQGRTSGKGEVITNHDNRRVLIASISLAVSANVVHSEGSLTSSYLELGASQSDVFEVSGVVTEQPRASLRWRSGCSGGRSGGL